MRIWMLRWTLVASMILLCMRHGTTGSFAIDSWNIFELRERSKLIQTAPTCLGWVSFQGQFHQSHGHNGPQLQLMFIYIPFIACQSMFLCCYVYLLYYIILYFILYYYIILYYNILYYIILYYNILYYINYIFHFIILYYIILYYIFHFIILYYIIFFTLLYYIILYFSFYYIILY